MGKSGRMSRFEDDLAFSEGHDELRALIYPLLFPGCAWVAKNIGDNAAQRLGVDVAVLVADAAPITVDEKLRKIIYPGDLLLEHTSNVERDTPGWMVPDKPQLDYLNCIFIPSRTGLLVGWRMLKQAWAIHGERWKRQYRSVPGTTDGTNGRALYHTASVAVPERVLRNVGVAISRYVIPFAKVDTGLPPLPQSPPPKQGRLL
jgi:hypothetical protein